MVENLQFLYANPWGYQFTWAEPSETGSPYLSRQQVVTQLFLLDTIWD